MNIEPFTLDAMHHNDSWYMLQSFSTPTSIVRPTPVGDEEVTDVNVYQLENGRFLLGFNNPLRTNTKNCYFVVTADGREPVTLQLFERIENHYANDYSDPEGGLFFLANSVVIADPTIEWRCDNTGFGPLRYPSVDGSAPKVGALADIVIYEPILSVGGAAHILYLKRNNDTEERLGYVTTEPLPIVGATIGEILKLVFEWSQVVDAPFDNEQEIAIDAKAFVAATGLTLTVLEGQQDMQVARYITGHEDARRRPDIASPVSDSVLTFVAQRVCHLSLSRLMSFFGYTTQEIAVKDLEVAPEKQQRFMQRLTFSDISINDAMHQKVLHLLDGPLAIGGVRPFYMLWHENLERSIAASQTLAGG
jgi:hypothetical protein